jgi:hypothetical protein
VNSEIQRKELRTRIIDAWDDVGRPTQRLVEHECEECQELEMAFANLEWKKVPSDLLRRNFGAQPLFSPEAFHGFLPAYLVYSLENFGKDEVSEFTIYTLSPGSDIKTNPTWWQRRFSHFRLNQLSLVYDFLNLTLVEEDLTWDNTAIRRGMDRLKQFVEPFLQS